ncbi:GNAT family N-acetyltransferase [Sulfurimonas sp.]|nr:GNAT family N-acetyltransferase [Sulfurimonas sp.]
MQIRELDLKELQTAYELVSQLHVDLSYKEFEDLIYDMRDIEYKMIGIMDGEELITYAGVCIETNLYHKRHLHVHELVTDSKYRGKKYGRMMLDYLHDYAKMGMCEHLVLSSAVSREQAHQFYEKHKFDKKGFIFLKEV